MIVAIHYNRQRVYIRAVLTHREYDKGKWKEWVMSLSDPDITRAVAHWHELAGAVFVPHSEAEYLRLVAVLDRLIDEVGEDESHPLASLMEVVGALIERYESAHVPELDSANERGTGGRKAEVVHATMAD